MAVLPILTVPDSRLRQKCAPVQTVDAAVLRELEDMLETMYNGRGIGLAAIQVGIFKRMIVLDVHQREGEKRPMKLVNPEVIWASEATSWYDEGCLSLPGQYAEIERPAEIKLRFLGENNKSHEISADGLLATCIQHEIDHLNGVLFVDHLSKLRRQMILKKLAKAQREKTPPDDQNESEIL